MDRLKWPEDNLSRDSTPPLEDVYLLNTFIGPDTTNTPTIVKSGRPPPLHRIALLDRFFSSPLLGMSWNSIFAVPVSLRRQSLILPSELPPQVASVSPLLTFLLS